MINVNGVSETKNSEKMCIPCYEPRRIRACKHMPLVGRVNAFSKTPGMPPDILHTFYSTCWLSMIRSEGLRKIDVRLGICEDKIPHHLLQI